MKKKIQTIIIVLTAGLSDDALGQGIESFLERVEETSEQLELLRSQRESDKAGAQCGKAPASPEIGFNYLWGSPSDEERNRYDISVTQELDMPTVYRRRREFTSAQEDMAEASYEIGRQELRREAVELYIEMAAREEFDSLQSERMRMLRAVSESIEKKYMAGRASIIELTKARVALTEAHNDSCQNVIGKLRVRQKIAATIGVGVTVTDRFEMPTTRLAMPFEEWYAGTNIAELEAAKKENELATRVCAMTRAERLPTMTVGYVSERTSETTLQGIGIGVRLPMWERRSEMRRAEKQKETTEMRQATETQVRRHEMEGAYREAQALGETADAMSRAIGETNITDQLMRAYETGQIDVFRLSDETEELFALRQREIEARRDAALATWRIKIYER